LPIRKSKIAIRRDLLKAEKTGDFYFPALKVKPVRRERICSYLIAKGKAMNSIVIKAREVITPGLDELSLPLLIDRSAESVQSLLPLLPGTYFLVLACGVDLALDEKDKSSTARICQSSCGRLVPVTLPRHDPTLLSRA
jgi:hypothetical protein